MSLLVRSICAAAVAASLTGCASSASSPDGGVGTEIRGDRYCEILLASLTATDVHVDVYTTFGLNDCPEAQWGAVDAGRVAAQQGVTRAILNGPRYWTLDEFVSASLVNPTPMSLGGIEMHQAAAIDLALSAISSLGTQPYTPNSIQRTTTVQFNRGARVYELVDPAGKVYDMQSYSTQKTPQMEADLISLESRLSLPTGWNYRTRILASSLQITAIGGVATVIQDDFENTYQLSQQ